ncbi:actin-binding FH2 [Fusarium phyllophilum]|uniref:Actin-binding FH2 n=1 Tax=Fusarium phyllophilum TaxID=47803 RepID=A0A8H5JRH1_9HYPO|nr:actin-binding FH2 [Fusarium phyllophilum]
MGLFDFLYRAYPAPTPPEAEGSPSSRPPSTYTNADVTEAPATQHPPPTYQEVTAPKVWKVELWFGSDPELLRQETPVVRLDTGWEAHLELSTTNIVGLMREGLYVSKDNVILQESCLTMRPDPQEHQTYYDRHFALSGPGWEGNLLVATLGLPVASNFRVEHLSADKVFRCEARDLSKEESRAYHFLIDGEENANYILDDTPLEGLWPWPRKELITQELKEEREQEGIEEGDMLGLL